MSLRPTPEQRILAVDRQEKLPDSMLNQTRRLLKRRNESFLKEYGDVKFFETGNDEVIAFSRSNQEGKYKVFAYNFSEKNVKVKIPLANGHLSFSLPAETSHRNKRILYIFTPKSENKQGKIVPFFAKIRLRRSFHAFRVFLVC